MERLTKAELRQELLDHGHHYLQAEPGRADRFVAQAVMEVQQETTWEWRRREETFTSGQTLSGLGRIEQVVGADDWPLEPTRRSELRDRYGRISDAGTARRYWREGEALGVHPVEDGLTVIHFTNLGWRSNDGSVYKREPNLEDDVPLAPGEFMDLIMFSARKRVLHDISQWDALAEVRGDYQARLDELLAEDGKTQVDEQRRMKVTTPDWA